MCIHGATNKYSGLNFRTKEELKEKLTNLKRGDFNLLISSFFKIFLEKGDFGGKEIFVEKEIFVKKKIL
jgi:hypothetical protein